MYRYITVHVKELLHMLHQHVLFWGIPNHSHHRNEPILTPFFGPQGPRLQLLPPRIHPRKEALALPLELCRTVATACPGDLRKGLQVAQLLSVPGRWEGRVRKGWRMVKISCKMPKFESWRLMFPETATKDWSIAGDYTLHGSFFGIEDLYLFISFTRFVHWRNLFCLTPLPPAKAPFLNAAWTL